MNRNKILDICDVEQKFYGWIHKPHFVKTEECFKGDISWSY